MRGNIFFCVEFVGKIVSIKGNIFSYWICQTKIFIEKLNKFSIIFPPTLFPTPKKIFPIPNFSLQFFFTPLIFFSVVKKRKNNTLTLDLDELSSKDWNIILTNSSIVKHKKNNLVFAEGSVNSYLYRVKSGKFRIEKKLPDGRVLVLNTAGVNSVFGEMSFLSNFPTSASVISDEDGSELYVLGKKIFPPIL